MEKAFVCSLCHRGIIGGALYLNDQSLTYKCQKLTIEKNYKKLVLPLDEIKELNWKWVIFPIAIIHMKNNEVYKFIIFNKGRFKKCFFKAIRSV